MAKPERRALAAFCCVLVCTVASGLPADARTVYQGAPDAAIFNDHFATLEEHEKALYAAPVGTAPRPPIASLVVKQRRSALPPLPDIHEVPGMSVDLLIARSKCPGCLPGPAAANTNLPPGFFEGAWRKAVKEGWRAGYDEMRAAAMRAAPPGVESTPARRAYYLRYIRRIVHGWQVAVVRTLQLQKKITDTEAARYMAVLDRTVPPPGAAPYAPQRIRTGWVSDEEMEILDRRYAPAATQKRLADADARRIEDVFRGSGAGVVEEKSAVEGNSSVVPFARLATGYAYDMLESDVRSLLPAGMEIWSRTDGNWALDTKQQRLVVSGGAAWPLDEATKFGTAISWGRSWRDGTKPWSGETLFVSPFVTHAMNEHLRLRISGGLGYRSDHIDGANYSVGYAGTSFYSATSIEGSWVFGPLTYKPEGKISLSRLDLASEAAYGEARARGRATYKNGFTYRLPETRFASRVEPFANLMTHWTFDRVDRDPAYGKGTANNALTGAFESGLSLKALNDLVDTRLATGVTDIGAPGETNYTVSGQLKFAF